MSAFTVVNAEDYGALPSNTPAVNDAAAAYIFSVYPAGVTICFPQAATYQFAQPFPWRSHLGITGGAGRCTRLVMHGGLFKPPAGTALADGIHLDSIYIDNGNATDHLIDLNAGIDAINFHVTDAELQVNGTGKSVISAIANSVNLFGFRFARTLISRPTAAGVPAIHLSSDSVGLNDWAIRDCQWHSHNSLLPFFFAAMTGPTNGMVNMVFDGIVSEQASNGAINLQGAQGARVENLCDHDTSAYNTSLVRIAAATNVPSNRCYVGNVGSAGRFFSFPGGSFHVKISGGTGHAVARTYAGDAAGTSSVS